jgi:hypothetical protein
LIRTLAGTTRTRKILSQLYSNEMRLPCHKDDKDQSLHELSICHRQSIVSQLVDIGNERNQQKQEKCISFIKSLQCLRPDGQRLRRTSINAYYEKQYVALSYTWKRSDYEDDKYGRYYVENWDDDQLQVTELRNCVLDRVIGYMRYNNVRLLWNDKHCIPQPTCKVPCTRHKRCSDMLDAMQVMDLVYQQSGHPVALLGRPLQIESELHLLACIISGDLVEEGSELKLSRDTTIHKAKKALCLLREITQDRWWRRAWTFQENYRGGERMHLLISHDPSLEKQKQLYRAFGNIPGEVCVLSISLFRQATRLCLALRGTAEEMLPEDMSGINDVLRAAGRYVDMLRESNAMTPTVVADIEARDLDVLWDRLAIIGNCCQYRIRLDVTSLCQQHHSLSLSVLALCLLNGEILKNDDDHDYGHDNSSRPLGSLTASEFLNKQLFEAFSAPRGDSRKLTFNKGCRFHDVKLTQEGVVTMGHLWRLGRVVDTARFRRKLPWINNPHGRLKLKNRKALLQLLFRLCDLNYRTLAHSIDEYLAADAEARGAHSTFTQEYLYSMASELAEAIRRRQKLRLGSIWDPTGKPTAYRAVFVWSEADGGRDRDEGCPQPAFAFTSAWSRDPGSNVHDANDVNRHVSLEVGLEESPDGNGSPHLRIRGWLLGMCFYYGHPCTEVVFPWPRALQAVKTGMQQASMTSFRD